MNITTRGKTLTFAPPPAPINLAVTEQELVVWHGYIGRHGEFDLTIIDVTLNAHDLPTVTDTPPPFDQVLEAGEWTDCGDHLYRNNVTEPSDQVNLCRIDLATLVHEHPTTRVASEHLQHRLNTLAAELTSEWHDYLDGNQRHLEETLTRWLALAAQAHAKGFTANDILTGNGPASCQDIVLNDHPDIEPDSIHPGHGLYWPAGSAPQFASWPSCHDEDTWTTVYPQPVSPAKG